MCIRDRGCAVDWRSVYARGGRPVSLPGYPWQRERYWLDGDGRAPAVAAKQESTERFRDWMYELEWVERARSAEAAVSTGESGIGWRRRWSGTDTSARSFTGTAPGVRFAA